jgi:hypothetical protein
MFQSFRPPALHSEDTGSSPENRWHREETFLVGDQSNRNILRSGESLVFPEGPALSDLLNARGCEAQAGRRCDTSRIGSLASVPNPDARVTTREKSHLVDRNFLSSNPKSRVHSSSQRPRPEVQFALPQGSLRGVLLSVGRTDVGQ